MSGDPRDFADGLRELGMDLPEGAEAWMTGWEQSIEDGDIVKVQEVIIGQVQEMHPSPQGPPLGKVYELTPRQPDGFASARKRGTLTYTVVYGTWRLGLLELAAHLEDWGLR